MSTPYDILSQSGRLFRWSGAGAPTSFQWKAGDAVVDNTGQWWRCTVAGTPGTWAVADGTAFSTASPAAAGVASAGAAAAVSRGDHVHSAVKAVVEYTDDATLALTDAFKRVEMNKGAAVALTIPANADVAFPVGTEITVLQTGAGLLSLVAAVGVTLNAIPGLDLSGQWASCTLIKRATDTWVAVGSLAA